MPQYSDARIWAALACLAISSLGLMFAMGTASRCGEGLTTVVSFGICSVALAATAARIAVRFSRR